MTATVAEPHDDAVAGSPVDADLVDAETGSPGVDDRSGPPRRSRRLVPWLAGLGGLVLVVLALGAPRGPNGPDPFDPRATDEAGTKALVLLLGQSGAQVRITDHMPGPDTDVALLPVDTTSPAQTDELERWVRSGGTLVVADPESSFVPVGSSSSSSPLGLPVGPIDPGSCSIGALSNLGRVWPSSDPAFYAVPAGSQRCYTSGLRAFVVDTPLGGGHIVSVGGATVFSNEALDQFDNAGLATDLMAPRTGIRVSVLWGMTSTAGSPGHQQSLDSLIAVGLKLALVELIIAFAVYAWFRARRLGRPVDEAQLVQVGGSELIAAHGNLLAQSRDPDRAARLLRDDLRRRLAERLGLSPNAAPEVVAEVTAARTGADRDRVAKALTDVPVRSESELVDLARDIDTIRAEVLHGTAP